MRPLDASGLRMRQREGQGHVHLRMRLADAARAFDVANAVAESVATLRGSFAKCLASKECVESERSRSSSLIIHSRWASMAPFTCLASIAPIPCSASSPPGTCFTSTMLVTFMADSCSTSAGAPASRACGSGSVPSFAGSRPMQRVMLSHTAAPESELGRPESDSRNRSRVGKSNGACHTGINRKPDQQGP